MNSTNPKMRKKISSNPSIENLPDKDELFPDLRQEKHIDDASDILPKETQLDICNCFMNTNSFQLKTMCVTLVSAILGFAFTLDKAELLFVSLMPILLFWVLDAYYQRSQT